jgi:hypothetical protein
MLGLGALLLGVAAIAFVGVAFTGLEAAGQIVVLLSVAVLFLAVPPAVAVRGLAATAETLAAVGLLLFAVAGYPLWNTGAAAGLPAEVYTGLVAAATAALGYGYHRLTGLAVPAWAALLAMQPVLPLVASPLITGAAGWALVFALVAAVNAGLATGAREQPLGFGAWLLHGLTLLVAIGSALAGLFLAGTVTAAFPAAVTLVFAGAVAVAGGLGTRIESLVHLGAGIATLAVIVAGSRLAWLAMPGRALLPIAAIMAATALSVRLLPPEVRRGPRRASAYALIALGVVVAGLALRAGYGALVWPPWPDDLSGYPARLADAVGPAGWQLAATAVAATFGAGLALPAAYRREVAVAGAGLSALAVPASWGLAPDVGAWVMMAVAAGVGLTGLSAGTRRAAVTHVATAGVVGLAAAGTSLADPALTATVLAAITITGVVVAGVRPRHFPAQLVTEWAAGAATLAAPGAAATTAAAAGLDTPRVLAAGFAAVCGSLGYAALTQLQHRYIPVPVRVGAGLGTLAVAMASFLVDQHPADVAVGVLVLMTALLVSASTRIDAIRRSDRLLDGADLAAAAVTASVVVTLARITSLVLPLTGTDAALATAAILILLVTLGVRVLPAGWRRGPVLGVTLLGTLVAGIGAAAAAVAGLRALQLASPVGDADLSGWAPAPTVAELSWAPPVALVLLAVAGAAVLPRPVRYHVSATLVVLATIAAPVGFGLPWWTPAALSTAMGAGYALAAVGIPAAVAARPAGQLVEGWLFHRQAAWPRAVAAVALAVYAVGTSLARSWVTAIVLLVVALVGTMVAALAVGRRRTDPRLHIGGTAVTGVLLAVPGALAAMAAHYGYGPEISLPAALGGLSLGFAILAVLHIALPVPAVAGLPATVQSPATAPPAATAQPLAIGRPPATAPARVAASAAGAAGRHPDPPLTPYLAFATVGVTAGATAIALATLVTPHSTGVYAAAAVLLAVLAELTRAADPRRVVRSAGGAAGHAAGPRVRPQPLVTPAVGALLAASIPAVLALVAIAPALAAALAEPYQTLAAPWQGPPAALTQTAAVPATSVLAALLLTLAAALAAVGFGGAVTRQAAPVIAPGLAVTMLIAPPALNAPWPTSTVAALLVFTIATLGVALTPPPPPDRTVRPLRSARLLVLGIGLAAGGAGLAGSLAEPDLTWATVGGAVAVGACAALGGKTRPARLLGWLFAAAAAQAFALVSAYLLGTTMPQAGFALLAVSAVALLAVARLRRLRPPREPRELAAVEWFGGYVPLAGALALASGSTPDLAAMLIGTGAVLGLAAVRTGRPHGQRRAMWWIAALSEVLAWWIMMRLFEVGLIEAYTLPFAVFALIVGALEMRYRPELGSWMTYGPGLVAALGPSLLLVVTTGDPDPVRQVWVILAGVATLLLGSRLGQRAPLIIGSVVTAVAALHLLSLVGGPWLMLVPLGILLLVLGANREKRQRDLERLRGAYSRMR